MLPQRNNYFYRELSVFQNEWLKYQGYGVSLSVDIVYQDESDYARLLKDNLSLLGLLSTLQVCLRLLLF